MTTLRDDRGETLVELMVAIVIVGIGAVAILGALQFSIFSSALGRGQSTGNAYVRSVAETIQYGFTDKSGKYSKYTSCASATQYLTSAVKSILPTGYDVTSTTPQIWSSSGWSTACSASADTGVQRVVLTVTSTATGDVHQAAEQLTVILRNPCNAAGDTPCA